MEERHMKDRVRVMLYFSSKRDLEMLKQLKAFSEEQDLSLSRGILQFIRMLRNQLDFAIEEIQIYETLLHVKDEKEREKMRLGFIKAREVRDEKRAEKYRW
jgi:hypothetical protein